MITSKNIGEVKFTYSEAYLPPRCKKLRYRDAEGKTTVSLALLTDPDKEAPVAFRFPDWYVTEAMGKEYFGGNADPVKKELRWFNEKLYERDAKRSHYCGGIGWYSFEEFSERLKDFRRGYSSFLGKCPDSFEEYEIAVKERTGGVLLMQHDGGEIEVWIECGEPMYMYNLFGLGHNHGGTGMFIEQAYNSNIPKTHYFNALHREDAVKAAIEAAMRRGDDQSVDGIRACETIEVLIPEAVRRNPMVEHGDGDPFINKLNAITEAAPSTSSAALLVMAEALKATK